MDTLPVSVGINGTLQMTCGILVPSERLPQREHRLDLHLRHREHRGGSE